MLTAITRKPARSISECELTYVERIPLDYAKALLQHDAYGRVLEELGCRVISLSADESFPDSVFVEDTAVVLPEVAIMLSPGVKSRQGEVDLIEPSLSEYRDTKRIRPPAFIDGGDVLTIGKRIFVGQSTRTNRAGFDAFSEFVKEYGYSTVDVEVKGSLHLKTACTALSEDTVLVTTNWLDISHFKGFRLLEAVEPCSANALRIRDSIVMHAGFPGTVDLIRESGFECMTVDVSEFGKAEAGLTCSSLIFEV